MQLLRKRGCEWTQPEIMKYLVFSPAQHFADGQMPPGCLASNAHQCGVDCPQSELTDTLPPQTTVILPANSKPVNSSMMSSMEILWSCCAIFRMYERMSPGTSSPSWIARFLSSIVFLAKSRKKWMAEIACSWYPYVENCTACRGCDRTHIVTLNASCSACGNGESGSLIAFRSSPNATWVKRKLKIHQLYPRITSSLYVMIWEPELMLFCP